MRSRAKLLLPATTLCLLLAGIVFGAGNGTYNYDATGRLESVTYADNTIVVLTYDANGNMLSRHVNVRPNQPDSGASNIGAGYVDFIWVGGDPNNDEVTYHILLDKNPDPTTDITPSGTTSVSFHYSGIECGTTYYWRVKAIDKYGAETLGPVWQFSTQTGDKFKNATTNATYTSLKIAYDAAQTGETILVQTSSIAEESFTFGAGKSVTIEGGYSCDFASSSGMTTLEGTVFINNGTVNLKNFIVSY